MELVSIVIPVYNVETFLSRCIESVQNQSYRNIEIILVDDGSTDSSGKICDEYLKKDNRIKVVHKENGGLSDARNTGLKICEGHFVTYIDSDDYVSIYYIENLITTILTSDADIVIGDYQKVYDDSSNLLHQYNPFHTRILSNKDVLDNYFYGLIHGHAWGNIYKKIILENHPFPVGKFYEDAFVLPFIILSCSKIAVINCKDYFYFQRENSIVNEDFSSRQMDLIDADILVCNTLKNSYSDLNQGAEYKIFSDCVNIRKKISEKSKWKKEDERLKQLIQNSCKKVLFDKKVNKKKKMIAGIACLNVDMMNLFNRWITYLIANTHLLYIKLKRGKKNEL